MNRSWTFFNCLMLFALLCVYSFTSWAAEVEIKQRNAQQAEEYNPLNDALAQAVGEGALDEIENLLKRGASPDVKVTMAISTEGGEVVEENVPLIMRAIYDNRIDIVKYFLSNPYHSVDVNAMDDDAETVLMRTIDHIDDLLDRAAANDVTERSFAILRLLLKAPKIQVNLQNKNGMTALMWASNLRTVNMLLNAGVDVNMQNKYGMRALMHAAAWNKYDIAKRLIEAGADYTLRDDNGKLAADYVRIDPSDNDATRKQKEALRTLLKWPMRVFAKEKAKAARAGG